MHLSSLIFVAFASAITAAPTPTYSNSSSGGTAKLNSAGQTFGEQLQQQFNSLTYPSSIPLPAQTLTARAAWYDQSSSRFASTEVSYDANIQGTLKNCRTLPNYIVQTASAITCPSGYSSPCPTTQTFSIAYSQSFVQGWQVGASLKGPSDIGLSGQLSGSTTDTTTETWTQAYTFNVPPGDYCLPALAEFRAQCDLYLEGQVRQVSTSTVAFESPTTSYINACDIPDDISTGDSSMDDKLNGFCAGLKAPQTVTLTIDSATGDNQPYTEWGCLASTDAIA
jgi:hypothetical protein